MKETNSISIRIEMIILILIFIIINSWISDDAYHAYIMAKHLIDGKGFVYNIGYRVNASTCPLYTLTTAIFYFLSGKHMYFAGILQGILFSLGAIAILFFKVFHRISSIFLSCFMMIFSYSFMAYTTSGLENSLLFLLYSIFFIFYFNENKSNTNLFFTILIYSLIITTRMDNMLILLIPVVYSISKNESAFSKKLKISLVAMFPFAIWEAFSIVYYGYPFPNTFYIKLISGFPKIEYYIKGSDYIFRSLSFDVMLSISFVMVTFLSYKTHKYSHLLVIVGLLLYVIYVISIGGDFMLGRHLTVPFFCSIILICNINDNIDLFKSGKQKYIYMIGFLTIMWIIFITPIAQRNLYDFIDASVTSVVDEQELYYHKTGLIPVLAEWNENRKLLVSEEKRDEILKTKNRIGKSGALEDYLPGITKYYIEEDYGITNYLTDKYGIMDPFLSHLPGEYTGNDWRIGHIPRIVPNGYYESIQNGHNQILDEGVHNYYNLILRVVTGDIFNEDRLITIFKMNLGSYDHLLDNLKYNIQ